VRQSPAVAILTACLLHDRRGESGLVPAEPFVKRALALIASILLVSGCQSPLDPDAVRNAELYFPPRFKYVEKPVYCFTAEERERALQEHRQIGSDTLFEFVVDSQGQVRKVRLVQTYQPSHRHEDILAHARSMVFSPDAESDRYRAFYFAAKYAYNSEFQWVND
jgi:hypothetical protein